MFTDFFSKDEADKALAGGNAPTLISVSVADNSPEAIAARDAANKQAEATIAAKAAEAAKAQGAPVLHVPAVSDVFDPEEFPFADRVYRIHFKNGNSGEYHGNALAHSFPFDPAEVVRIEHAESVGVVQ